MCGEQEPPRAVCTHYTLHGVARLDCIYVTSNLSSKKIRVETVLAAFTDHLVVCLHMTLDATIQRQGRGRWKMNITPLCDTMIKSQLQQ